MKAVFLSIVLSLVTSLSWAHGDGESRISIEPEAQGTYSAGVIQYSFQLFDAQTNKALSDKNLVLSHTKILHFIAYDPSRNEFNHVHPSFDGKAWNVELNLLANGNYFFWAQGQLVDGTEFSTVVKAQIINGKPEIAVVPLADVKKATDKKTTIQLGKAKLKAGAMAMIDFKVTREDGQEVQLTPYLGALAHIIAVSPDGDELIHVHPMAGNTPDTGMIHATFPSEGDYRVWIQLVDRGELKTIPLSVIVSK
ncbi:MAG: hypothetical protein H7328_10965 [Bdellovibrio sp.]|nr:hypothetical protein [Bdellovibrio sp.]